MTLEFIYWLTLGVGLGFFVLAVFIGDVFDFFDIDFGGAELSVAPMFFAATAAFGAGGLVGVRVFEVGTGPSVLIGVGNGAVFGGATGFLFALLHKQEKTEGFALSDLVGANGRCTVALGPGTVGQVSITSDGMTRAFSARSDQEIAVGDEIVVSDVTGRTVTVTRPATPGH